MEMKKGTSSKYSAADFEQILEEKDARIARLESELSELKRLVFGRKSERFVPKDSEQEQLNLFTNQGEGVEDLKEKKVKDIVPSYQRQKPRKKAVRQKLPSHLEVVRILIEPKEDCEGWTKIGEEITQELYYVPAQLRIIQYIRPKYARPKSQQDGEVEGKNILIAPLPSRVIEKGIPSAGLLAHLLLSKFIDHLPYYRQIKMFERIGMKISASTINGWVSRSVDLLRVLYQLHRHQILKKDYLMADETPIKVIDSKNKGSTSKKRKGKTHTGYFWVYHHPQSKQTLFIYDPGRGGQYPRGHLQTFTGHLQTDGYSVYDAFEQHPQITLLGCMAHARRKFEHALDNDLQRAEKALGFFQKLYAIERYCRDNDLSAEQRLQQRQQQAKPILKAFNDWLEQQATHLLPKSAIAKAIGYTLNRWKYLERYCLDGRFEIDNNLVENSIRPVALGRKNYLFAGSPKGAEWAAILYSLFASAVNLGLNSFDYLKDVLQRLPDHPINRLDELLPENWTTKDSLEA